MKDSRQSFQGNDLTTTAFAVPVIAVLAIVGGLLISDSSALANEPAEATRINADLNESYFASNDQDVDRLAQGQLEPRSENQTDSIDDAENEEDEDINAGDEVSEECGSPYLSDHLRIDFDNDEESVLKLQSFLKTYEGYDYVSLNGNFDESTLRAVKAFQTRYAEDILEPWGYQADEATGYVYITTTKKINEIYCDEQFLLSQSEQEEIREYRQKLNAWRAQGASFETPQYLANYYGRSGSDQDTDNEGTGDQEPVDDEDESTTDEGVTVEETPRDDEATSSATTSTSTEEADDRSFFERLFGIGGDDEATSTATTTATSTATSTDDDDDRGFFARLFGIGDDDTATTSTSTDTDTTDDEGESDGEPEEATSSTSTTATTSGLDNVAAGVYSGVNSVINFLLSPTFLLIVLVILILLLVATLIEKDDDEVEGVDESQIDSPDDDEEESTSVEPETEYEETEAWKSDADSEPVSELDDEDESDVSQEDDDETEEGVLEANEDTSSSGKKS